MQYRCRFIESPRWEMFESLLLPMSDTIIQRYHALTGSLHFAINFHICSVKFHAYLFLAKFPQHLVFTLIINALIRRKI